MAKVAHYMNTVKLCNGKLLHFLVAFNFFFFFKLPLEVGKLLGLAKGPQVL